MNDSILQENLAQVSIQAATFSIEDLDALILLDDFDEYIVLMLFLSYLSKPYVIFSQL